MVRTIAQKFLGITQPPLVIPRRVAHLLPAAVVILIGLALAWLPLRLAALAVSGTIFLVLAVLYPVLALYALIPAIPFSSLVTVGVAGARVGAMELLLLLAIALWLLRIFTSPTVHGRPFIIKTGPLLLPFVIFLSGVGLSWLTTFSLSASLIETIKWLEMLALVLFIVNLLPSKQIKWVVWVILLAGVIQAGLGLYQFIFKVGPEGFLLFGGRFLRAYGTFAQPNPYGGYLGLILPLALAVALWQLQRPPLRSGLVWAADARPALNRWVSGGYWLARLLLFSLPLLLMVAALFASQSRGAWLGFAAASLVTVIVLSKRALIFFSVLTLVAALVLVAGSFNLSLPGSTGDSPNQLYSAVMQRLVDAVAILQVQDLAATPVTDANFATIERLAHWQAARDMWRDHPWLGVGFGNYAAIYPAYAVGRWQDPLGHAHNYLLNIGAEAGLVGMVTYLIFWIWAFGVSLVTVYRSRGFFRFVAAGGMGIFTHLHVHNMVDNLYVQGMYLHVAIILGLIAVLYLASPTEMDTP